MDLATLNDTDRQILTLLMTGKATTEIAQETKLPTYKIYLACRQLRERFGVQTNEALVITALQSKMS